DVAALAGAEGAEECRGDGEARGDPGEIIDDRESHARGRTAGLTGQVEEASLGLGQVIVAWPPGARTAAAVPREMCADEAFVDVSQVRVGDPKLGGLVAPEIVDHGIRLGGEPPQRGIARGVADIENDAPFGAIE